MVEPRHFFGPFVLDAARGLLQRTANPSLLANAALLFLRHGVVSKAHLLERAWPNTIVEEGNLTVQIAALRKLLGPARAGQEWIATVPRIGYRLARPSAGSEVDAAAC